jgi:hypothetical protein
MSNRTIKNLDTLEKEIFRLKLRQKEIEHNLDKNVMGLKKNYGSMIRNSVMGGSILAGIVAPTHFWSNLLVRLLENKKLQDGAVKLVDNLSEKIGDGIGHVAAKFKK